MVRDLLAGRPGPVRDAVVLNAAAGVAVHAAEDGEVVEQLLAARSRVEDAIDSGQAAGLLDRWVAADPGLSRVPSGQSSSSTYDVPSGRKPTRS